MNHTEQTEFYIATCRCCLIAEQMKACLSCRFRVGLPVQVDLTDIQPSLLAIPVHPNTILSTAELQSARC